jgi:predicted alpha/beta-fold hydrolase
MYMAHQDVREDDDDICETLVGGHVGWVGRVVGDPLHLLPAGIEKEIVVELSE